MSLIVVSITSPRLCDGIDDLTPTPLPICPKIKRVGIFAGRYTGS